jgi:phosphate transport system substrate-binding protein
MVACQAPTAPSPPAAELRPILRVVGTDRLAASLLPALAATHEQSVNRLDVDVSAASPDKLFDALLSGRADVVVTDREHLPAEEEQARANGFSLADAGSRSILAVDVVALAVHPKNPMESLTYDQVRDIWCTGTLADWSDLGMEARPIRPLTLDPASGTRATFEDFFCGPRGMSSRIPQRSPAEIAQILAEDPAAIAIVSMADAAGRTLGLRSQPGAGVVFPSQANVIRGSWPLALDVYLYTRGQGATDAASFVTWIGSPGAQEVIDEARFIPLYLRPERLDEPRPLRETVHFDAGSARPDQRSQARIDLLVDELRDRAGEHDHVVLEGYTDPTERDPEALSRSRAEAVRALLERELPGLFFEIIPRGARTPIAPNETPLGRQLNRRVQIYLEHEYQEPGAD